MNSEITNHSYVISLLSAEVVFSDLPEPTMPISIFAGTGITLHYIDYIENNRSLETVVYDIKLLSNPFIPKDTN